MPGIQFQRIAARIMTDNLDCGRVTSVLSLFFPQKSVLNEEGSPGASGIGGVVSWSGAGGGMHGEARVLGSALPLLLPASRARLFPSGGSLWSQAC